MKWSFLVLACGTLYAGDGKPRYYSAPTIELSPERDIRVEYHRSDSPGISPVPEQIWLASTLDPGKRHLLFSHERSAEVLFCDDEKWLVINNHNLSGESRVLLFRRKKDLEYEQTADLTDAAWHFFGQEEGSKDPQPFDHAYVSVLRWAGNDPPTLLLCLQGHLDSRNYTSEWYCLYNVASKTFSVDFKAHNKKVTRLE